MCLKAELRALALLALSLAAAPLQALPEDRLQAIEISAERALRDEKAGYTVYSGAVILQQGSLHIEADKLTVFHDREAASRIVAVGKPARLRQQPEPDKGFVTASAGRIVYEASREHVLLRQSASIEQEGAVVSGESIDYFLAEQRVRADADSQDGSARVQVVIPAAVVGAETRGDIPEQSTPPGNPAGTPAPKERTAPAVAILAARSLAKSYRGRAVVRDVSLQVSSAQVVGLLGPNGAGKTTCFYMIVGIVASDAGDILIDGESITALPMHERARRGIGYLPQEASIFRRMSVGDNLLAILETRKNLNRKARLQRRDELLEEFHVSHLRDSLGQALSGGERRRVEIARALAMEPKFVLLDEPFAGVDPISVGDIKNIIRHLQTRGIGVLITDHNVRETLDICEVAYIVGEGHIIAEGTPQDVLDNAKVRKVYLGENFRL